MKHKVLKTEEEKGKAQGACMCKCKRDGIVPKFRKPERVSYGDG